MILKWLLVETSKRVNAVSKIFSLWLKICTRLTSMYKCTYIEILTGLIQILIVNTKGAEESWNGLTIKIKSFLCF